MTGRNCESGDRKHLVMFLFADLEPSPNSGNDSIVNRCTFALGVQERPRTAVLRPFYPLRRSQVVA